MTGDPNPDWPDEADLPPTRPVVTVHLPEETEMPAAARRAERTGWPRWRRRARFAAFMGMSILSSRIYDIRGRGDRVALADARTSMCDLRAALCITNLRPCDRNGFSGPGRADWAPPTDTTKENR